MAERSGSGWVKKLVAVVCIGGSALAIYNVNSDVAELKKQAEHEACGDKGCQQLTGMTRNPTSQVFTFQLQSGSAKTTQVECSRQFLLFGAYTCKRSF
ncbi:MAG TPA: hypothetical protein VHM70_28725 [Polyangiaceae bacterium]|jgi:hypothetical protein|nr:hypothetical protein [Polyangiaceae bacterium]